MFVLSGEKCWQRTASVPKGVLSMIKPLPLRKSDRTSFYGKGENSPWQGKLWRRNCSVKPSLNENPFRGTRDEIVGVPLLVLLEWKTGSITSFACCGLGLEPVPAMQEKKGRWEPVLCCSPLTRRRQQDCLYGRQNGRAKEAHPREPEENWRKLTRLLLTRCPGKSGCRGESLVAAQ